MRTIIEIRMENAAFEDTPDQEVARILRALAQRIEGHAHFSPGHDQALQDANWNEVGYCQVKA